jgi:outer membrane protein, heavy metal efflux system
MKIKYRNIGKIIKASAFFILLSSFFTLEAQQEGGKFLESVESLNLRLNSARKIMEASVISSQVGINPDDPSISYGYMPGSTEGIGIKQTYGISQSLEFPTVYFIKKKMAEGAAAGAEFEYLLERQKVLKEALLIYNEYISLLKKKKEYFNRYKQAESLLHSFTRKFEIGEASILELNKSKIQYLNSKTVWQMIVREIESAEKKLQLINGNSLYPVIDSTFIAFPVMDPDTLKVQIQQLNPELLYLNQQVVQAEMNIRLIRHQSLPELMLSYEGESVPEGTYRGVRTGISIPLWKNRNRGSLAQAETEYAKIKYEERKAQLFNDVERLHQQMVEYRKVLSEYDESLAESENIRFLNKALEMGQLSIIDYFTELTFYYDTIDRYMELEAKYYEINAILYSFLL